VISNGVGLLCSLIFSFPDSIISSNENILTSYFAHSSFSSKLTGSYWMIFFNLGQLPKQAITSFVLFSEQNTVGIEACCNI